MAKPIVAHIAWLLLLFGLWMMFVVTTQLPEVLLGLGSVVFAAALVGVMRAEIGPQLAPRRAWMAHAWVLVPRLFTDTVIVFGALFRQLLRRERALGSFLALPYEGDQPNERLAQAADAFIITANSLTPNTIVLDVDRVEGAILIHQLVCRSHQAAGRELICPR